MKDIRKLANPFDRYAAAIMEYIPAGSPLYLNNQTVLNWAEQEFLTKQRTITSIGNALVRLDVIAAATFHCYFCFSPT